MRFSIIHRSVFILFALLSLLPAQNTDSERYQGAYELERKAEYEAAEELYRELYEKSPQNYNYYTRYKYVLNRQRKFSLLIPLLEDYSARRSYDHYLRLELGVLYYAEQRREEALSTWAALFKGKSKAFWKNYAGSIYQNINEYGLTFLLEDVIEDLRQMTEMPELLTRYAFINHLNFRNWDKAAKELGLLIEKQADELPNVKGPLFSLEPELPLFEAVLHELEGLESREAFKFLSELYLFLDDDLSAVEILCRDTSDLDLQISLQNLARRLHQSGAYKSALEAAEQLIRYGDKNTVVPQMSLLAARIRMDAFFRYEKKDSRIPLPYPSRLLEFPFPAYDSEYAYLAEDALKALEALLEAAWPISQEARYYRAELLFRVYHDIDVALQAFLDLAASGYEGHKNEILARIADCYQAGGEFQSARDFLKNAGTEYRLMVHEEDRLAPYQLKADFLAADADSVLFQAKKVLALLPENDVLYNEVISFAAFVSQALRDSLHKDLWLQAEALVMQNKISEADRIFWRLMKEGSYAMPLYAMRSLECRNIIASAKEEEKFWKDFGPDLRNSFVGDYFTIRYAEYLENIEKNEKAVEIYEEFLLSYQESMYYEMIRQYMRERKISGAP